ncbi:MAG: DNA polymerase I [Spirochaetales bacterium]|nr:DNA polymerase I [Spirochaetales bacterium]
MIKALYLIDGYNLIYQAYYAFKNRPLFNPEGRNSSAIYGFFRSLFAMKRERHPSHLAVVFDSKVKTFRHKEYPPYKAQRDATPEELHIQIDVIEEILKTLGISLLRCDGFEADDIIATLAQQCKKENFHCFIITKDKDILQVVGDNTVVLRQQKGANGFDVWNRDEVHDKLGIYPEQLIDYLALTGDQSDNIPGVQGIGPKTAVKLLEQYNTLDNIYAHIQDITPESRKQKLQQGKDSAELSRRLVTLRKDVPLNVKLSELELKALDIDKAIPLFSKEGMKTLVEDLGGVVEEELNLTNTKSGAYATVTKLMDLERWIDDARKSTIFAFDIETDSTDDMLASPIGFSLCTAPDKACYIPIKANDAHVLDQEVVKQKLRELLGNPQSRVIGQNIKYDYKVLKRWGITITGIYFDTMIAAWVLESGSMSAYNIDKLAEKYLNHKTIKYGDLIEKKSGKLLSDIDLQKAADYAAEDADITFKLYLHFKTLLKEQDLVKVFYDIEMPLVRVLADMELEGIRILPQKLRQLSGQYAVRMKDLEEQIYKLCGKEFNINSTKQLQQVLFTERDLKPVKKTKTGYSTDTQVLEILSATTDDAVPRLVLEHRSMAKLKNTYLDTLPELIHTQTGRIHTQFIQTGTTTGRLASKDPNLQNIPIRDEDGRKIREAFVPKAGSVFLSADYSQIELAVLAHLSHDTLLIDAFNSGRDVHTETAAIIFNEKREHITPDQRRLGKTINFGVIYGMSSFRLARDLKISRKQAEEFINSYFEKFRHVKIYIENTIKSAEVCEYVQTIMGRKRKILNINSKNRMEKMAAERIAVNTTVQGSAADIVKCAMLEIAAALHEKGLKTTLLLQVHDELIFEVPEAELASAKDLLKSIMENVVKLKVGLKVNIECGESWGNIH